MEEKLFQPQKQNEKRQKEEFPVAHVSERMNQMEERITAYEEKKKAIHLKNTGRKKKSFSFDDSDMDPVATASPSKPVPVYDVVQLGSKIVIGAGVGLLAGVAAIAVIASAAEVVIAGVVTKIAGVVGGSAALSWGLRDLKSKRERREIGEQ
jgi:hypothetical protein